MPVTINGNGLIEVGGTTTTQGRVRLAEDFDNGTNYVELTAPASVAANRTVTFPDADVNFATGLNVAQGGTGTTSLTANNVILGNGTSAVQVVAPGTAGNLLTSTGTTWTSSPPASTYVGSGGQVYTSGINTFTIPTGVTALKVTVVGGGGSGQGATGPCGCTVANGNTGGTSSVSSGTQTISTISATGGTGGMNTAANGGLGSGGDLNNRGMQQNNSGTSIFSSQTINAAGVNGAGGGGQKTGGAGGSAIKFLTGLTPGNTLTVTIGAGGAQVGTSPYIGYAGGNGVVMIEW